MIDPDFGKRFNYMMEKKQISNAKLTEMAKLSKNDVGNYKKGQIPNAILLHRLSQIFGVSMEYLLTGKEAPGLSPEEQRLIDSFRRADDRGRRAILRTAEQEAGEAGVSISGTGSAGTGTDL